MGEIADDHQDLIFDELMERQRCSYYVPRRAPSKPAPTVADVDEFGVVDGQ